MREDDPLFNILYAKAKVNATIHADKKEVKNTKAWSNSFNSYFEGAMLMVADFENLKASTKPHLTLTMPVPSGMPKPC
jgi:hypothetical protein